MGWNKSLGIVLLSMILLSNFVFGVYDTCNTAKTFDWKNSEIKWPGDGPGDSDYFKVYLDNKDTYKIYLETQSYGDNYDVYVYPNCYSSAIASSTLSGTQTDRAYVSGYSGYVYIMVKAQQFNARGNYLLDVFPYSKNADYCSYWAGKGQPCTEGESDCDYDYECASGLKCMMPPGDSIVIVGDPSPSYYDGCCPAGKGWSGSSCVGCTQNHHKVCSNSQVYWYDSCGNKGNPVMSCAYGCNSAQNDCGTCTPNPVRSCQGNSIIENNGCGSITTISTCSSTQKCSNNNCVDKSCNELGKVSGCTLYPNTDCLNGNPVRCTYFGNTKCFEYIDQCSSNEKCEDPWNEQAKCVSKCTSQSYTKCENSQTSWYDSCNNKEPYGKSCPYGCNSAGSDCKSCTPNALKICENGGVTQYDSCGNYETGYSCLYGCNSAGTDCKSCTQNYETRCSNSEVYYYDSCGNKGAGLKSCAFGCNAAGTDCGACLPNPTRSCQGNSIVENDGCATTKTISTCSSTQKCSNAQCIEKTCEEQGYSLGSCNPTNIFDKNYYDQCVDNKIVSCKTMNPNIIGSPGCLEVKQECLSGESCVIEPIDLFQPKCKSNCVSKVELCDGKDNQCQGYAGFGQIDEGFNIGDSCYVGSGECKSHGVVQCDSPTSSACSAVAGQPQTEICDYKDNDCDGEIDEVCVVTSICGDGVCDSDETVNDCYNDCKVCDIKDGSSARCDCNSNYDCPSGYYCKETDGWDACVNKPIINECNTVNAYSCKSGDVYRCENYGNQNKLILVDACSYGEVCPDDVATTKLCKSVANYELNLEFAQSGTQVIKQPGDRLRVILKSDIQSTFTFNYDKNSFTLESGPCESGVFPAGKTSCVFRVNGNAFGKYVFSLNEDKETVQVIHNPYVIFLTNSKQLYRRYNDRQSVDVLLSKTYDKAAINDGIVYDLNLELPNTPFDYEFSSYHEPSTPTSTAVNTYVTSVSDFVQMKCTSCREVIIVGDDYVVPSFRQTVSVQSSLWSNNVKNDLFYTDYVYAKKERSSFSGFNRAFLQDYNFKGKDIVFILPKNVDNALEIAIDKLKSEFENNPNYLAHVNYITLNTISCKDKSWFNNWRKNALVFIGNKNTNPVYNCYSSIDSQYESISMERNIWSDDQYVLAINSNDPEVVNSVTNLIKTNKIKDLKSEFQHIFKTTTEAIDYLSMGGAVISLGVAATVGAPEAALILAASYLLDVASDAGTVANECIINYAGNVICSASTVMILSPAFLDGTAKKVVKSAMEPDALASAIHKLDSVKDIIKKHFNTLKEYFPKALWSKRVVTDEDSVEVAIGVRSLFKDASSNINVQLEKKLGHFTKSEQMDIIKFVGKIQNSYKLSDEIVAEINFVPRSHLAFKSPNTRGYYNYGGDRKIHIPLDIGAKELTENVLTHEYTHAFIHEKLGKDLISYLDNTVRYKSSSIREFNEFLTEVNAKKYFPNEHILTDTIYIFDDDMMVDFYRSLKDTDPSHVANVLSQFALFDKSKYLSFRNALLSTGEIRANNIVELSDLYQKHADFINKNLADRTLAASEIGRKVDSMLPHIDCTGNVVLCDLRIRNNPFEKTIVDFKKQTLIAKELLDNLDDPFIVGIGIKRIFPESNDFTNFRSLMPNAKNDEMRINYLKAIGQATQANRMNLVDQLIKAKSLKGADDIASNFQKGRFQEGYLFQMEFAADNLEDIIELEILGGKFDVHMKNGDFIEQKQRWGSIKEGDEKYNDAKAAFDKKIKYFDELGRDDELIFLFDTPPSPEVRDYLAGRAKIRSYIFDENLEKKVMKNY